MKLKDFLSATEDILQIKIEELGEVWECSELRQRKDLADKSIRIVGADYATVEITFEDCGN